jgi:hypothetical protein
MANPARAIEEGIFIAMPFLFEVRLNWIVFLAPLLVRLVERIFLK